MPSNDNPMPTTASASAPGGVAVGGQGTTSTGGVATGVDGVAATGDAYDDGGKTMETEGGATANDPVAMASQATQAAIKGDNGSTPSQATADQESVDRVTDLMGADSEVLTEVVHKIGEAHNVLVALSSNPSVDEMAAAIGLSIYLDKLGKRATAIYSGTTPNALEFLKPEETFESTADVLQDFVIALNKDKADHLRYKLDGDYVKIYITPYKSKVSQEDLEYSYDDYNVDLVLSLDVANGADLDAALREHGRIMHDSAIINITTGSPGKLGEIEWSDKSASSISEMIARLLYRMNVNGEAKLEKEEATAFLTGIVAATDRFSNARTTPETMRVASRLMESGANQQLVSRNITADIENEMFNFAGKEEADSWMNKLDDIDGDNGVVIETKDAKASEDSTKFDIDHRGEAEQSGPKDEAGDMAKKVRTDKADSEAISAKIKEPVAVDAETADSGQTDTESSESGANEAESSESRANEAGSPESGANQAESSGSEKAGIDVADLASVGFENVEFEKTKDGVDNSEKVGIEADSPKQNVTNKQTPRETGAGAQTLEKAMPETGKKKVEGDEKKLGEDSNLMARLKAAEADLMATPMGVASGNKQDVTKAGDTGSSLSPVVDAEKMNMSGNTMTAQQSEVNDDKMNSGSLQVNSGDGLNQGSGAGGPSPVTPGANVTSVGTGMGTAPVGVSANDSLAGSTSANMMRLSSDVMGTSLPPVVEGNKGGETFEKKSEDLVKTGGENADASSASVSDGAGTLPVDPVVAGNPAMANAPNVMTNPEINGVPEINYSQALDDPILPPPPAPPVSAEMTMPGEIVKDAPTAGAVVSNASAVQPIQPAVPVEEPEPEPLGRQPAMQDQVYHPQAADPAAFKIPGM